MKKICMIVPNKKVKGGIAAVIDGYYGSILEKKYNIIYVESYRDGGKVTKLIKAIIAYFCFIKVLIVDNPDIVHIHSSFGPSFYRKLPFIYLASWRKKRIINHIHGADFEKFYINASKQKKAFIQKVYNKCTVIVALSQEWKEKLSLVVPSKKIEIIENYSILHEDALEGRQTKLLEPTVLFLGEIGKRKGCYDIPAVAEEVVKFVPNVKFIIAGVGSLEDEKAVKLLFKNYRIENHIVFPGWVRGEQKEQLLWKASVFFLPSYNEGMPMSILDAMGYGLPIVSTNVGGIPKIVHHGENGYCCVAGDTKQMAEKIIHILTDNHVRWMMAQKSLQLVKESYSLEKHLKELCRLYDQL